MKEERATRSAEGQGEEGGGAEGDGGASGRERERLALNTPFSFFTHGIIITTMNRPPAGNRGVPPAERRMGAGEGSGVAAVLLLLAAAFIIPVLGYFRRATAPVGFVPVVPPGDPRKGR